jgi:hypothetical protein
MGNRTCKSTSIPTKQRRYNTCTRDLRDNGHWESTPIAYFPHTHAHVTEFGMKSIEQLYADHEAWLQQVREPPPPPRPRRQKVQCGAYARSTGQPCRAKALANGRCKNHGGMSTGPRTPEGKARALANLKQYRVTPE